VSATHTPGPWSASKIDDRAAFNIFTPGQCSALLTLEPGKHNGADPRTNNVEADARLIAAAPDLLAIAQFFLRGIEGGHIRCAPYIDFDPNAETLEIKSPAARLREAIAKATWSAA
jgi:hypothetical protein